MQAKKLDMWLHGSYKSEIGACPDMKTEVIRCRLGSDEREAFQAAADLAGLSISAWMRERLRRAARRELEEGGRQIAFLQPRKDP